MTESFFKTTLRFLADSLRADFGQPAFTERAIRELAATGELAVDLQESPTAYAADRIRWSEFGQGGFCSVPGRVSTWTAGPAGDYRGGPSDIEQLGRLYRSERRDGWTVDARFIDGLSASRSNLSEFTDLDDFANKACKDLLADASPAGLARLMAHDGGKLRERPGTFDVDLWSGRIYLRVGRDS